MKKQLKEIILQIGIEQAESILAELEKEKLSQNKEAEAREFLVGIFNQIKVRVEKVCPNTVFYDVGGLGTVFEQDAKNKRLWVSNKHVWSILESKFGHNYQQAKELIRGIVEDILNWGGYTPSVAAVFKAFKWKTS